MSSFYQNQDFVKVAILHNLRFLGDNAQIKKKKPPQPHRVLFDFKQLLFYEYPPPKKNYSMYPKIAIFKIIIFE